MERWWRGVAPSLAVGLVGALLVVGAPLASASTWVLQPVPDRMLPAGLLAALSCSFGTACMAVGSGPAGPLIARWDGRTWATQSVPRASVVTLSGVSCSSVDSCMAVGWSGLAGHRVTFAERWNGSDWSVEPMPPLSGVGYALRGVSCPAPRFCVAVGSRPSRGRSAVLVERWNGSRWSAQDTPNRRSTATALDGLTSVSCTSTRACMAVGGGLVERWNGSRWSVQTVPIGPHRVIFTAVSCSSARACVALAAGSQLVWARWNGRSWTVSRMPDPGAPLVGHDSDHPRFLGVSCTSATQCTAVGFYFASVGDSSLLTAVAERLRGSRWSIQYDSAQSFSGALAGVSCTAPRACTTVGYITPNGAAEETLAMRWDGRLWTVRRSPNQSTPASAGLVAVSCTSASACTAVGSYQDYTGTTNTLAESWNGSTWSVQDTPDAPGPLPSRLNSVSCTSAQACIAVGSGNSRSGNSTQLAKRWDGARWTIMSTPDLAFGDLSGISCTSANACTAVGSYAPSDGVPAEAALAEHWDGARWTIENVPDPVTGVTAETRLSAVSCLSASDCTAVGLDSQDSSGPLPLAERWDGNTWSIESTAGLITPPSSVSCTSADACLAVGYDLNGTSSEQAEQWDGMQWTLESLASGVALTGVSCTAASDCTAVGTSSPSLEAIAEVWNGTVWIPQSLPTPVRIPGVLGGVSCISSSACVAVGNLGGEGPTVPIALRSS
jgi:hypothetical protein